MIKRKEKLNIFIVYYLPIILWMGLIFYLSSISGLRSGTESISFEIFLRKLAHTLEYLILTFLFWRVTYFCWGFSMVKASFISLFLCILYATSDELHQFFVQDRAGKILDVLIDTVGGILGIVIGNCLKSRRKIIKKHIFTC